ncbi:BadF/BadG/BcrA/BcrD ATPase family protein [Leifsonia poae]|uniref:BadF/BadG/BcrA/BcrD ATPase family protein n=1 Tax=Leifsonia poae TaxID=110933 RepID=UPI001CBD94D5|nr:BadF/BadG/BcrA/BcrD ATPase family protein [Leifsonia poae]
MTDVIVGLDAGGTKLGVRVAALDGSLIADVSLPAEDWSASPAGDAARWLIRRLNRVVPEGDRVVAVGVGAQGCDTVEHCGELAHELGALGYPASVVNDAALLVPAAGLTTGIGVIAGTGSIAVGGDATGETLFAGGWGWVIGDDGGAPAVVREATIAALAANDDGEPDDGLLRALLLAFGVDSAPALARAVNDTPTPENWGPRAIAVFAAADAGSALAVGVVERAADHLAHLVDQLVRRGAVGETVVTAGSVIANQPRLSAALSERIAAAHPSISIVPLADAPVAGGIELARRLTAP